MKNFKYNTLTPEEQSSFPGNAVNWKYRELSENKKQVFYQVNAYNSKKVGLTIPHKFLVKDV